MALDSSVELGPQVVFPITGNEWIDEDGGIRRLVINAANVFGPVGSTIPIRMRCGPVPEPRNDLSNVHHRKSSG
jgi:hypothetical protein